MSTHHFTLNQAAKEVGKSTSTIHKALKNGKLSYVSKDDNGYKIDPSELFRVFEKPQEKTLEEQIRIKVNAKENSENTSESLFELKLLLKDLEHEREKNKMLSEQLQKAEEREKKLQSVNQELAESTKSQTLLIEDMRKKTAEKSVEERKGFLGRLLG